MGMATDEPHWNVIIPLLKTSLELMTSSNVDQLKFDF